MTDPLQLPEELKTINCIPKLLAQLLTQTSSVTVLAPATKEKKELLETENKLLDVEVNPSKELQLSKTELNLLVTEENSLLII